MRAGKMSSSIEFTGQAFRVEYGRWDRTSEFYYGVPHVVYVPAQSESEARKYVMGCFMTDKGQLMAHDNPFRSAYCTGPVQWAVVRE